MLVRDFVVWDVGESLKLVLEVEIEGHRKTQRKRVKSRENASGVSLGPDWLDASFAKKSC